MHYEGSGLRLSCVALAFLLVSTGLCAGSLFKSPRSYSTGGSAFGVTVADLNGDGKADLIVANQCYSCLVGVGVLLGNGDGSFQPVQTYDSGADGAVYVAVADVNGDGKPDVLVSNLCYACGNGVVGVLLGNGDGSLQTAQTYSAGGIGAHAIVVGDVNRDGKN